MIKKFGRAYTVTVVCVEDYDVMKAINKVSRLCDILGMICTAFGLVKHSVTFGFAASWSQLPGGNNCA